MPFVKISSSVALTDENRARLLTDVSRLVAASTGKPESYVMVVFELNTIMMGGTLEDAAFADVRGIGLGGAAISVLAKELCGLFEKSLGITPARVYLNFTDVAASRWGWNADTFG